MPRRYLLDFEKPLVELEKQIEQIRELARDSEVDVRASKRKGHKRKCSKKLWDGKTWRLQKSS